MKLIRRLYDWVLSLAYTPHGSAALFVIAFIESSFFPIPPDVLLLALAISLPAKAFRFALLASLGSVLGGIFGYGIGYFFMDAVGLRIVELYGLKGNFEYIQNLYKEYDAVAVVIAGFTPIPYKVFTIAAGAFKIDFGVFVVASAISRSLRFFILAGLIYYYGKPIKAFIDKYFSLLTIVFGLLLFLGFLALKLLH
ncbi:MAG: DedA family protein [Deltaproteobacteria bacterium]|nr:DedA family protein [Deltaproteobacteria bacterium]